MDAPNTIEAFARAEAYGVLAARRLAWSRGYLVILGGCFAATVAALEIMEVSGGAADVAFVVLAMLVLLSPSVVNAMRARRGLVVTAPGDGPGKWPAAIVMTAAALFVYGAVSLMPSGAIADSLLAAAGLAAVGGWVGWNAHRIGSWEMRATGLAFVAAGLLLAAGSKAIAFGTLAAILLPAGVILHLRWRSWEARNR